MTLVLVVFDLAVDLLEEPADPELTRPITLPEIQPVVPLEKGLRMTVAGNERWGDDT